MAAHPGRHCPGCAASSFSTPTTSSSSCWAVLLRIYHRRSGRFFTNWQDTGQLHCEALLLVDTSGRTAPLLSSVSSTASSSCLWLRRACYGERAAPSCWRSGKLARHAPHSCLSVRFLALSSSADLPVRSRMLRGTLRLSRFCRFPLCVSQRINWFRRS